MGGKCRKSKQKRKAQNRWLGLRLSIMVEAAGIEPAAEGSIHCAESTQNSAKVVQFSALRWKASSGHSQNCALPTYNQGTSPQSKCVPSVHHDPDLASLVAMWDDLPDLIRARILELARTDT
jgi:hypothetical protein